MCGHHSFNKQASASWVKKKGGPESCTLLKKCPSLWHNQKHAINLHVTAAKQDATEPKQPIE